MRVLVTGANGFVGATLCTQLAALGYEIVPAVRRQSGIANELIVHDSASWRFALKDVRCVIHLAGRAHVMHDQEQDPLKAFRESNVNATVELAKRSAEAGVRRFVFVSTIKINGEENANEGGLSHDDPVNPRDPYAISKWEAEQILWRVSAETGMQVVVLRPPLVYGPRVKGNFLRLLQAVERGWPLPFGRIQNKRSLIYVGNLISAINFCMVHQAAAGKTLMVSDNDDLSTPDLICCMATVLGKNPRLLPVPPIIMYSLAKLVGKDDTVNRLFGSLYLNINPILQMGWLPPYTMRDGLIATADWYMKNGK
jgi:UDP-glucose 4-epimerase